MLNLLWKFLHAIGQIFIVTNGQKYKNPCSQLVTLGRAVVVV